MQNEILNIINMKEDETEQKVQDAAAEAAEKIRQLSADNELRVRTAREKLEKRRREMTVQTETEAAEQEKEILVMARKEADVLRQNALAKMDVAKALVMETVLRNA